MDACGGGGGGLQYEDLGRSIWELQESALHQLAEAAEKKKLQVGQEKTTFLNNIICCHIYIASLAAWEKEEKAKVFAAVWGQILFNFLPR